MIRTVELTDSVPCPRHHYWMRFRAWVADRRFFHHCDLNSIPLSEWTALPISGGVITTVPLDGIERLRRRVRQQ